MDAQKGSAKYTMLIIYEKKLKCLPCDAVSNPYKLYNHYYPIIPAALSET